MNILIVHHQHMYDDVVKKVEKYLDSKKITHKREDRECLTNKCYKDIDLIIVIGGDGTFLRASHLNKNIPMLGINPDSSKKEGFFMQANISNYKEKINKILRNDFKTIQLLRLKVEINGKKLNHLVLNDVYIGDAKPYNLFNYNLIINGKKEFQRGSGLIIGTPAGSTAWLKSLKGYVMDIQEEKFQFVARDLYNGRLTPFYTLKRGLLNKNQAIEITCLTPAIVVIDSITPEVKVEKHGKIKVSVDNSKLNYIKV